MIQEYSKLSLDKTMLVSARNDFLFFMFVETLKKRCEGAQVIKVDLKSQDDLIYLEKMLRSKGLVQSKKLVFAKLPLEIKGEVDFLEISHRRLSDILVVFWTDQEKIYEKFVEEWKQRRVQKVEIIQFTKFDWRRAKLAKELFSMRSKDVQDDAAKMMVESFPEEHRLYAEIQLISDVFSGQMISLADLQKFYINRFEDQDYFFESVSKMSLKSIERLVKMIECLAIQERKRLASKLFQFLEQVKLMKELEPAEIKEMQNLPFAVSKSKQMKLEQLRGLECHSLMQKVIQLM